MKLWKGLRWEALPSGTLGWRAAKAEAAKNKAKQSVDRSVTAIFTTKSGAKRRERERGTSVVALGK